MKNSNILFIDRVLPPCFTVVSQWDLQPHILIKVKATNLISFDSPKHDKSNPIKIIWQYEKVIAS